MYDLAHRDIQYLPGVGPGRATMLRKELGINTLHDLLYYFPYKHIDRSRLYYVHEIDGNMPYIQLRGRILSYETQGTGRKQRLVAHFSDGTGIVDLVWFQGATYIPKSYPVNTEYIVFGKPTVFGGRVNIAHPDIDKADTLNLSELGLRPFYNTTERMKRSGLNSGAMEKLVRTLFGLLKEDAEETLPPWFVTQHHLMALPEALRLMHFPKTPEELRLAEYRLKFEELFYIQLNILRYTRSRRQGSRGLCFTTVGPLFNTFYNDHLPFRLTGAQMRVIKEMRADMNSGRQMNRLLQGDVGSGKTLVALLTILIALDNGCQACLMAPTEILASQHFASFQKYLAEQDITVELLVGSLKASQKKQIKKRLAAGEIDILIGTHALIEDDVKFQNLGYVVIDEQHRFGVEQRAKLWNKSTIPPHILVMTATPIPRTLAMTLYADLECSVIDELPPGRQPIRTTHGTDAQRLLLFHFMKQEIAKGRQVYVVYPLINESESLDLKDLMDGYESISRSFPMPQYQLSIVHGQMPAEAKAYEMDRFKRGETHIMVSTTVIEVGVNVPNATVMIIENAERFGLSQLHQLRGRVGRGADQSYCILLTRLELSKDTRTRMETMVATNDGFRIAEADLQLRGPGDLEGTQQSGLPFDLKIASLSTDGQLLEVARKAATEILDKDPLLEDQMNRIYKRQLDLLRQTTTNWSEIS